MKNLLILLLLFNYTSYSQDIIVKSDGEEISANVIEISPEFVKYKKPNWDRSPIYNVYTKDVEKIIFSDGYVEILSKNKNVDSLYTFIDERDNIEYDVVKIGGQDWFAENLKYKSKYSWCYHENEIFSKNYGRLYIFEDAKKSCPDGWHLPTDNEWKKLEMTLGMSYDEANDFGWRGTSPGQGKLLKKGGESHFNAYFSGYLIAKIKKETASVIFYLKDTDAYFWTSTEYGRSNKDLVRHLNHRASVERIFLPKDYGLSVRCVKDK